MLHETRLSFATRLKVADEYDASLLTLCRWGAETLEDALDEFACRIRNRSLVKFRTHEDDSQEIEVLKKLENRVMKDGIDPECVVTGGLCESGN